MSRLVKIASINGMNKEAIFRGKHLGRMLGGKKTKAGKGLRNAVASGLKGMRKEGPEGRAMAKIMRTKAEAVVPMAFNRKTLLIPGVPTEPIEFGTMLYGALGWPRNIPGNVASTVKYQVKRMRNDVANATRYTRPLREQTDPSHNVLDIAGLMDMVRGNRVEKIMSGVTRYANPASKARGINV